MNGGPPNPAATPSDGAAAGPTAEAQEQSDPRGDAQAQTADDEGTAHGKWQSGQGTDAKFGKIDGSIYGTLNTVRGDELLSTTAPSRRWLVGRFVPAAETTMLGGDGGTGKTTLALQLALAGITGGNWLGLRVERCNVLYLSAEDPKDEIHYRLEQITKSGKCSNEDLARFKLIDLAGMDATIATFDKNGLIKPTPLFVQLENAAREHKAGCIILDFVADFFGGDENNRREVRAFVGLLRGLSMRLNAAVVFLAHPSVDGIKTGRGYSGSTHWNNAVGLALFHPCRAGRGATAEPRLAHGRACEVQSRAARREDQSDVDGRALRRRGARSNRERHERRGE